MVVNQTDCFRLEQRSVIKVLVTEKCKIYWRICDVYGKAYDLVKKMFTSGLNMGLLLQASVEKTAHKVETHWLSVTEKVPGTVVSKESHVGNVLNHEKTHYYWFPWKRCNYEQCYQLFRQYSLYWMTLVYKKKYIES